jgi:hypothetical protein
MQWSASSEADGLSSDGRNSLPFMELVINFRVYKNLQLSLSLSRLIHSKSLFSLSNIAVD